MDGGGGGVAGRREVWLGSVRVWRCMTCGGATEAGFNYETTEGGVVTERNSRCGALPKRVMR